MTALFRAGLILLGLLSVADLALPLVTDGEHPPTAVALVAAALGLASIALIVSAWRGAQRAVTPLVVVRVLSAASATPALFMSEVPSAMAAGAASLIALTAAGVVAVLVPSRRVTAVGAS